MAEILKGKPVADAMTAQMMQEAERLKAAGIIPTLCIFRVGEQEEDLAYERGAMKRCDSVGVRVVQVILPRDVSQSAFDKKLHEVNADPDIHGILMFRPLPAQLNKEKARRDLAPEKDVDGCTDLSLAGVFTGSDIGFAPCTAQAVMEILRHYDVDTTGKRVTVIGRSLVIGRPVAMLLMRENATVTICHTRSTDIPAAARDADILIATAGRLHLVTEEYTNPEQVIIDVGINWDEAKGGVSGDVDFDRVAPKVKAISPVPGGVGSVTTCVLVKHVLEAARRAQGRQREETNRQSY